MDPVTVSLTEEHIDLLEELSADDGPCTNRSEAMRMIIDQYTDAKELERENERLREEYEQRIDELESENKRLQRQLAATNRRVDEHQELVEYVSAERERQQRREERRDAPAWRRAKWWLLGREREE